MKQEPINIKMNHCWLIMVLLIGFMLRFFVLVTGLTNESIFMVEGDSQSYLDTAKSILKGSYPAAHRPPGYPVFLLIFHVLGLPLWTIILAQIIIDSLNALIFMYLIFKLSRSQLSSIFGGLLYTLNWLNIHMSTVIMSETIFTTLMLLCVLILLNFLQMGKIRYLVILAVLMGIAVLTRVAVQYLPIIVCIMFLFVVKDKMLNRLKIVFLFASIFFVAILPWCLTNLWKYKRFMIANIMDINIVCYEAPAIELFKSDPSLDTLIAKVYPPLNPLFKEDQQVIWDKLRGIHQIYTINPSKAPDLYNPITSKKIASEIMPYILKNIHILLLIHAVGVIKLVLLPGFILESARWGVALFQLLKLIFLFVEWMILLLILSSIVLLIMKKGVFKDKFIRTFCVILIVLAVYYLFLPGPQAGGRFLAPVRPLLLCFACLGLPLLLERFIHKYHL